MTEPTPDTVVSIDDFQEFIGASYDPILAAFTDVDLGVSIEAGSVGHYLLVARPAGVTSLPSARVEVTSNDKPLPADPDDVTMWVLSCGTNRVKVPASYGVDALVMAVQDLLYA